MDTEIAQGIVPNPDVVNSRNIKYISASDIEKYDIKVGDGVFVVNERQFIDVDVREQRYLKPLYEPTDLQKYNIANENPENRIIYITKTNYREDAPTLLAHLKKYSPIMEQRRENLTGRLRYFHLHWPREERFFVEGEKILVPRKSATPMFSYTTNEAYVMMAVNIIFTDRVDMKYLTGLLNSKLISYWLRNKGKMQGANYQLDKEPLQQIPIAVPSNDIQGIIAKLVDMIILLNTTDMRASELVQNSYISSELERLIDGCIYEIYLPDEMAGMSVTTVLRNYIKPKDTICINDIWELYMKIDSTGIIESLNSLSLSDSEALRTIILS